MENKVRVARVCVCVATAMYRLFVCCFPSRRPGFVGLGTSWLQSTSFSIIISFVLKKKDSLNFDLHSPQMTSHNDEL